MSKSKAGIVYAFTEPPAGGQVVAINDTVKWLRMPLPFALAHINLWLVADGDGWAAVDTGICDGPTKAAWETINTAELGGAGPTRVVVTHMHPDHAGMAGWLCERFAVRLWMTRSEYYTCRVLTADTGRQAPDDGVCFYRAAGLPATALARYSKMFGMFGRAMSPLPDSFMRLQDGEMLAFGETDYEVVMGNGHSPEHACLFNARDNVLLSGDQILPTISSNVSVWPTEPSANPLRDWLASCARLRARLPHDVLVLPAHGKPFRGAHTRLTTLIDDHHSALEKLLALCAQPRRAVDVFAALFKSRISDGNLIMATGEAVAHLNYLVARNDLEVTRDADGVDHYSRR